ncbi:hypothetical protein C8Q78DRAFT_1081205 [Trametes maxima]|nr:hypothetical protein C8Q78DRAFT_1081205 [Trametes maxima]
MDSPSAASNSSYYSFDSHGTASPSIYSTPMASPAMQMGSSFPSPSRPGTSALPNLPSSRNPLAVAPTLLPTSARISVPQTITRTSKRSRSLAEYFKIGGVPGVPVRDVVKDRVVMDNPDERVLERTGVRQIHLVIAWPGYEQSGTYIRVQDRNGFITRGQLAKLVCTYISRFMGRAAKLTQTLGPEHEQWKIGKRNVTTDNLWLLSVGPAQHNIWLANLEIYQ